MCGINGIISKNSSTNYRNIIENMNIKLNHRGPDNSGIFNSDNITLGHARLSIIDLSKNANQPMISNDKRYIIVYNGEIYNFMKIKKELGYKFISKSDSEVILAAYIKWGNKCLDKFNGMFAFAIWDKFKKKLFLARDRLGIKPLYYYLDKERFIFSSEIRSIISTELFKPKLSKRGLIEYLKYQTVRSPNTIIKNINMLESGSFIYVDNKLNIQKSYFWKIKNFSFKNVNHSYDDIKHNVKKILNDSVKKRMFSDVPFGAFLSGGIDSSILVGLMSENSNKKIKTFNIYFDQKKYNENLYAKMISNKFSTDHTEIKLNSNYIVNNFFNIMDDMDHPSSDGMNTWVISKFTRDNNIKMVFSGLGGDEIFGGYPIFKNYYMLEKNKWIYNVPLIFKKKILKFLAFLLSENQIFKLNEILKYNTFDFNKVYSRSRIFFIENEISELINYESKENLIHQEYIDYNFFNLENKIISKISISEIETYMKNILLRDVDQMSMAHSLEVRVPFLDHKLVEYIISLNDNFKFPHNPKKLLIDTFSDLIPKSVYNRSKMGFQFPWNIWLANDLKKISYDLILSLSKRKIFNERKIISIWKRFEKNNNMVNSYKILSLITLEYWLVKNNIYE